MRSGEPIALVEPHFAGCGDPVHSFVRIVVEEKLAFASDAPGDFERNALDVNEINASRQIKLPWQRRIVGPPSADIEIGRRPCGAASMATKHEGEFGPIRPKQGDHRRSQIVGRCHWAIIGRADGIPDAALATNVCS